MIVGCEGILSGWNLGTATYNSYYADAARSMSLNSHALLFGAFDPGATITLDKLSGFLVPQVISIWVFGFHPWSTMLPQVVEGMLTVLACYVIGARWKGPAAGVVAAAAVATTPLLVSMFGRGSEDAMITMSLALAFWCWQSALLSGRLLPLLGACVWVAVGFQAKMMQAWFIVPAVGVAYLLAAPHPWVQRIRRVLLAGGVTLVLSLSWVTFIQLTPASERPYIDGTTDNNAFTMVFGYNGFNRLIPNLIPGVVGNTTSPAASVAKLHLPFSQHDSATAAPVGPEVSPPIATAATPAGTVPRAQRRATPAAPDPATLTSKLLLPRYTTQVGWLYPMAAAGAVMTLWPAFTRYRRTRRCSTAATNLSRGVVPTTPAVAPHPIREDIGGGDMQTAGETGWPATDSPASSRPPPLNASTGTAVALLGWLIMDVAFLSATNIPHPTYLAAVSVQLAVFSGVAIVQAAQWSRSRRWARFALPTLMVLQVAWTVWVLQTSRVAPTVLAPAVAAAGLVLTVAVLRGVGVGVGSEGLRGQGRSVLRRPWVPGAALVVLLAPALWSLFNITVYDGAYADAYGGPQQVGRYAEHPAISNGGQPFHVRSPLDRAADPHLSAAQQNLLNYLRAEVGPGTLMAVDSWRDAEPFILDTGSTVIPIGGFRGVLDTPTLAQLQVDIGKGQLRFVLLHSKARTGPVRTWITSHCALVPESTYQTQGVHLKEIKLYTCAAAAQAEFTRP